MQTLRLLSLFSGIGGFDLGLERSGAFKTVAFCEIDPFCRRVLAKHWPEVTCYEDVTALSGDVLAADGITVDAICGGFPCQDISLAGKGAGIEGERSGLWREFARLIGDIRPAYAIIENVAALKKRGLDRVLRDLATLGYDAEWHCIPASAIGAPHQRDRIWIIANSNERRKSGRRSQSVRWRQQSAQESERAWPISNSNFTRLPIRESLASYNAEKQQATVGAYWRLTEPAIYRGDDGVPSRVDRLKGLGNSLVPQIPELIGLAIKQHMESFHGA